MANSELLRTGNVLIVVDDLKAVIAFFAELGMEVEGDDVLCARGYKASYLWTTHELAAASSLYRRHGFVLTEERGSIAFGKPLREQRYEYTAMC